MKVFYSLKIGSIIGIAGWGDKEYGGKIEVQIIALKSRIPFFRTAT